MQRPDAHGIISNLDTTSDKIRALAHAGYDRTEISQVLGIRYQHVRKVMVDAGIVGGLRRKVEAEREPVLVDAGPAPREVTSWDVLLSAGFQHLGQWTLESESAIRLDAKAPNRPGVYAFVLGGSVAYVGLTNNSLRARLDQYRAGHRGQKTNARVKELIVKALADSQQVKVLVATPEPLQWNRLPVITAAGLEAGLIQMIRPAWNITGAA
ncbi:MAG: GIY-YIG nuclease family protein [Acidisphaera sp.]|nr:GIY-YIG nuclease family protein [Acidisphaera sp.]